MSVTEPGPAGPSAISRFDARMAALGPFEASPHVAVACSGGSDSMALALLADGWAKRQGGRVTALVVDHRMRVGSTEEAALVRDRLARAGVEAVVLTRQGPAPGADRQAVARRARYALMEAWCAEAEVLHLLLGHQRGDQAETLMLRLGRGSGVDGLAAMAPVTETGRLRLLRPLLDLSRDDLLEVLRGAGLDFVSDPTNEDASFARVRMRRLLPALTAEGISEQRLATTAAQMGRARNALEAATGMLLARAASVYPEGYARLAPEAVAAAPDEVALRALAGLLGVVGGAPYRPRLERLERLLAWLRNGEGGGRTLAGCRVMRRGGDILVCREARAAAAPVPAVDGAVWDGRFRLSVRGPLPDGVRLGALGRDGWSFIVADQPTLRRLPFPAEMRQTMPALMALEEPVAVPHLSYRRIPPGEVDAWDVDLAFIPARPLGAGRFATPSGYA